MSGVVIRCQHCGTMQGSLGECDACHEGEARYFCPNHTPGRWLDGPACSVCGAAVGVPPKAATPRASAPPRLTPPPLSPPPRRPDLTRRPGVPRRPVREAPVPIPPTYERPDERRDERREEVPFEEVGARPVGPRDLLEEIIRMRRMGTPPLDVRKSIRGPLATTFGCLRRLVVLAIILAVLAAVAFYYLFGVGGVLNVL